MDSPDTEHDEQFDDIPLISDGLIAALRKRFPHRRPQITDSDRMIFVHVGYEELIDWLEFVQSKQLGEIKERSVAV